MTYRDLIDIPQIPWTGPEDRFRLPPRADAPRAILTPTNPRPGTARPNAGRKPKAPRPLEALDHKVPGCQGNWNKQAINKFGHQVVACWKCKATRITKREA